MTKENNKINKEKINCVKCKARFDVWLVESSFPQDIEERVRKRFFQYCGACKKYKNYSEIKES